MRETVLITLMLAALNLLKVMTADIINAHITHKCPHHHSVQRKDMDHSRL